MGATRPDPDVYLPPGSPSRPILVTGSSSPSITRGALTHRTRGLLLGWGVELGRRPATTLWVRGHRIAAGLLINVGRSYRRRTTSRGRRSRNDIQNMRPVGQASLAGTAPPGRGARSVPRVRSRMTFGAGNKGRGRKRNDREPPDGRSAWPCHVRHRKGRWSRRGPSEVRSNASDFGLTRCEIMVNAEWLRIGSRGLRQVPDDRRIGSVLGSVARPGDASPSIPDAGCRSATPNPTPRPGRCHQERATVGSVIGRANRKYTSF